MEANSSLTKHIQTLYILLDDFAAAPKTGKMLTRNSGQGRNQMMFDLGLDPEDMDDEILVRKKIQEIEESFDLVMIAEHFTESLVLLKTVLCWDIDEVTNFKLNGRKDKNKSSLSNKTRNLLEEFLRADYLLYNHFYHIFQSKIQKFGADKLRTEVSNLEQANRQISTACSIKAVDNEKLKGDEKWWGQNLIGYEAENSTNEVCSLMTMPELSFIDRIRKHQIEEAKRILDNTRRLKTNNR